MESPSRALTISPISITSPARRRRISITESKNNYSSESDFEFEFWNSPSLFPQPNNLLSADELFSDGFLLPLQHLLPSLISDPDPEPDPNPPPNPEPDPSPLITSDTASSTRTLTASKRWKEIFKKADKKAGDSEDNNNNKPEKKKDRRNKNGGSNSAELNINIWPFSRSRSAGTNSGRSRPAVSLGRKASSAPCSRSNSSGESKLSRRSWPSSPGRAGVHLGRTSPVWQVRRTGSGRRSSDETRRGKARVLNLNVPMCIGYRQDLSCRSDENGGGGSGSGSANARRAGAGDGGGSNGNLFSLRGLFSKKSVLTV